VLLGQEFWIWMSLLTFFSLSTGRDKGPGPRLECSAKISMFFICRIFFNFVRFFFILSVLLLSSIFLAIYYTSFSSKKVFWKNNPLLPLFVLFFIVKFLKNPYFGNVIICNWFNFFCYEAPASSHIDICTKILIFEAIFPISVSEFFLSIKTQHVHEYILAIQNLLVFICISYKPLYIDVLGLINKNSIQ
jgi:hypothetical protein